MLSKIGLSSAPPASFSGTVTRALSAKRRRPYRSNPISIPEQFLLNPPSTPVTIHPVDFEHSPLPEYTGHVAFVLENVLSPEECRQIIGLAEDSALRADGESAWQPALVSLGPGQEIAAPGYRESDRIIWDQQTVVNRLWERCSQAEGVRDLLARGPPLHGARGQRWVFRRFNERMRFLKYAPGQYFKPHCDGPYYYVDKGTEFETQYTVQLYLNDSVANDPQSELEGGATSFLSKDKQRRIDVNPKAGSVLIFQHDGLFHEGAIVTKGTKYTMRTDILYEFVTENKLQEEDSEKLGV